jgi:hypothetical protein
LRQRPRPRHLMWGGQPNSDLEQAPSWLCPALHVYPREPGQMARPG